MDQASDDGGYYFITANIQPVNAGRELSEFRKKYQPQQARRFRAFTGTFAIRQLPAQTYRLNLALKSTFGKTLASTSQRFEIKRPHAMANTASQAEKFDRIYGYSEAQLDTFLHAMGYIASKTEREFIDALRSYKKKKAFFYRFWKKRQKHPSDRGSQQWYNYLKGIRYANQQYTSNFQAGWKTDRGRVLLTYGPPSNMERFYDPDVFQIWVYDQLRGQSGVYFVFSNSERASNEYLLVHSTLNGETYDPQWQRTIDGISDPGSGNISSKPVMVPNTTGAAGRAGER
jgi:GWxTD domain-containing protein